MKIRHILLIITVFIVQIATATTLMSCTNNSKREAENTIILEKTSGFENSEEHARELYTYQLAQDLKTAILNSPVISDVIILLELDENFVEDNSSSIREPSASILLTIADNSTLANQDIQRIAEIIRNGVPNISNENITITDSNLNFYIVDADNGDINED